MSSKVTIDSEGRAGYFIACCFNNGIYIHPGKYVFAGSCNTGIDLIGLVITDGFTGLVNYGFMLFRFIVDEETYFLINSYFIGIFFKQGEFQEKLIAVDDFKQDIGRGDKFADIYIYRFYIPGDRRNHCDGTADIVFCRFAGLMPISASFCSSAFTCAFRLL